MEMFFEKSQKKVFWILFAIISVYSILSLLGPSFDILYVPGQLIRGIVIDISKIHRIADLVQFILLSIYLSLFIVPFIIVPSAFLTYLGIIISSKTGIKLTPEKNEMKLFPLIKICFSIILLSVFFGTFTLILYQFSGTKLMEAVAILKGNYATFITNILMRAGNSFYVGVQYRLLGMACIIRLSNKFLFRKNHLYPIILGVLFSGLFESFQALNIYKSAYSSSYSQLAVLFMEPLIAGFMSGYLCVYYNFIYSVIAHALFSVCLIAFFACVSWLMY